MKLGVIKAVTTSGERVVLEVQIDEARYKEVALLHPLGLRIRAAAGDRVLVGQLEANADALFAWPVTISREVEPAVDIVGDQVWARSPNGTAVPLATKADLDAHVTWAKAHVHPDPVSGFTTAPTTQPPDPVGTSVFKGE
jgi:hypothetical protein